MCFIKGGTYKMKNKEYNFSVEEDTLIRNEVTETDDPDVFSVKKIPIITKDIFIQLLNIWGNEVKTEEEDENV